MLSTPKKRPLGSLTPAECQTLFALAFDLNTPVVKQEITSAVGPVAITGRVTGKNVELVLYRGGGILASWLKNENEGLSVDFNAAKVVTQVAKWGIEFGPETPTSL